MFHCISSRVKLYFLVFWGPLKNISEDTQKMPQSRSSLPKEEMRKIVTEKNAKKNCNRGTALEQSIGKQMRSLNRFYSRETPILILVLLHITNLGSVRIRSSISSMKHQCETHIIKNTVLKQSKRFNGVKPTSVIWLTEFCV